MDNLTNDFIGLCWLCPGVNVDRGSISEARVFSEPLYQDTNSIHEDPSRVLITQYHQLAIRSQHIKFEGTSSPLQIYILEVAVNIPCKSSRADFSKLGMQITVILINIIKVAQNARIGIIIGSEQSHYWVHIQRLSTQYIKEMKALACLLQHDAQEPTYEIN